MKRIKVQKERLEEVVKQLINGVSEPLFRGLGGTAELAYEQTGMLIPFEGNISVGKGVFFTNSLKYAISLMNKILVITTRQKIDPELKASDTREPDYDMEAKERLDKAFGKGNYTGMQIWREIQKKDTITYEGGPETQFVYTKRDPVTKEQILVEIEVE